MPPCAPGPAENGKKELFCGSFGSATANNGQNPQKMMPFALWTGLDHVGRIFVTRALQLEHIALFGEATTMFGQTMTKYIGHEHDIDFFTDRAHGLRWLADIAGRPQKFGVGIAHGVFADPAALHLIDECPAGELVVDHSAIATQHVGGKTHALEDTHKMRTCQMLGP